MIEYEESAQIIYPSAIYVDRSFTDVLSGSQKPECEFRNSPNRRKVSEEEITQRIKQIINSPAVIEGKQTDKTFQEYYDSLTSEEEKKKLVDSLVANQLGDLSTSDGNNLIGNVLNKCDFKVTHGGEKITYRVWAKPVYPSIDALKEASGFEGFENFIEKILSSVSDELGHAFGTTASQTEEFAKLAFSQLGGSCTAVVLERDLKDAFVTEPTQQTNQEIGKITTVSTDKSSYISGETIKLRGQIEIYQGTEKEVRIEFYFGPLLLKIDKVTADEQHNFEWIFQLPEEMGSGKYRIVAKYGSDSKEAEFTIS